jgi:hypothetical protein
VSRSAVEQFCWSGLLTTVEVIAKVLVAADGKLLVEKYFKGSSGQIELYPNEITQFLVWSAPESVQQKIRSKVEASHQKREQSKQLLEIAKTGVERALERWVHDQDSYSR